MCIHTKHFRCVFLVALLPTALQGSPEASPARPGSERISIRPLPGTMRVRVRCPSFPGEVFSLVVPESVGHVGGLVLNFPGQKPEWKRGPASGSARYSLENERVRYEVLLVPMADHLDVWETVENRTGKSWSHAFTFPCFGLAGSRKFADPKFERTFIPVKGTSRRVCDMERTESPRPLLQFFQLQDRRYGKHGFIDPFQATSGTAAAGSYIYTVSEDGAGVVGAAARSAAFLFQNGEFSCIHACPDFGVIGPGESRSERTRIYFLRGGGEVFLHRVRRDSGDLVPSLRAHERDPSRIGYQAVEIHLPWADGGNLALRFPETLRGDPGLFFIDHVRRDMQPLERVETLPDWITDPRTGALGYELHLPGGISFGARATPAPGRVQLEFHVKNGTGKPLRGLSAQFCLVETAAPPFCARDLTRTLIPSGGMFLPLASTRHENMSPGKPPWIIASVRDRSGPRPGARMEGAWSVCREVADSPVIGTTDPAGRRVVAIHWEAGRSLMSNGRIPCLHADPEFPACPPGKTVSLRGEMILAEGNVPLPEKPAGTLERKPGPLPRAEIRERNGAPILFINGRPHSGLSYMTYRPVEKYFRQFGEQGIHLYSFSATPTESGYGLAPTCWVAPDRFDDSGMDNRAAMVLKADPRAYFFPRLYLSSPRWWDDLHGDELVTHDPGDGIPVPFYHGGNRRAGKRVPSWASLPWRRDTARALRRLIRHVETSPYGDRVIGYHLASGTTEEWMQWGSNEDQWVDYSPANVRRFREWLRSRYGNVEKLRSAWGNPSVTFENAAVPTRGDRGGKELGLFRDPERARPSIDYVLYNSWLVADTIKYLAGVVKEATDRRALVGVFYGYVLQLAGGQREQNAGHLAIADVLGCEDIDFLTSPTSYAFRGLGTGYSHFMSLTDSVKLHGKLWIDENDIRTWLVPGVKPGQWGKTETFEESLLCQEREFSNVLAQACGMWWFDMSSGWYDHPGMLSAIGRMGRLGAEALEWDRSPVAEIAFVVDDRSSAYLSIPCPESGALLVGQQPVLGRIGAPFASIHLADLDRAPPYKLLIFPNAVAPSEVERKAIARAAGGPGRIALFQLAPGLIRDGALDEKAMEDLTGIRLRLMRSAQRAQTTLVSGVKPWTVGVRGDRPGRPFPLAALPGDPEAAVLGRSREGEATVVLKEKDGRVSIFSAGPLEDPVFLRNLARKAGVHLYAPPGDIVYANRSVLAVSVNEGGSRKIELPEPSRVTELFTGRLVGEGIREFTIQIPARGTALFHMEREPRRF